MAKAEAFEKILNDVSAIHLPSPMTGKELVERYIAKMMQYAFLHLWLVKALNQ